MPAKWRRAYITRKARAIATVTHGGIELGTMAKLVDKIASKLGLKPANSDVCHPEDIDHIASKAPIELEVDPRTQPAPCCGGKIGCHNVAPLDGEVTHCASCGALLVFGVYGWANSG